MLTASPGTSSMASHTLANRCLLMDGLYAIKRPFTLRQACPELAEGWTGAPSRSVPFAKRDTPAQSPRIAASFFLHPQPLICCSATVGSGESPTGCWPGERSKGRIRTHGEHEKFMVESVGGRLSIMPMPYAVCQAAPAIIERGTKILTVIA